MLTPLFIHEANTPFERLAKLVYDTYLVVDPGVLKLICAVVISHRLPADPVWQFLVAGSSGGKTELLNALNDVTDVHPLDSITSNTFISGQANRNGKESSLLFRHPSSIITLKDFTTVLAMQRDVRSEIMGQLRKIYDGEFTKSFGTGEDKTWRGKITMLSGVTTSIYTQSEMYAAMGERFIMYAMLLPDRMEAARRAINNATSVDMKERRLEIRQAMKDYMDSIVVPEEMPQLDPEFREELIELANLATLARSAVERDWHSINKEITFVHDSEMPTRFATQLSTIGSSMMVMNGGPLIEDDKAILYKISLDSIHKLRRRSLQELRKGPANTAAIATALALPTSSIRRYLEELNAFHILHRQKTNKEDVWTMQPKFVRVMSKFDAFPILEFVPPEEDEIPEDGVKVELETQLTAPEDLDPATREAIQESFGFADDGPPMVEGVEY